MYTTLKAQDARIIQIRIFTIIWASCKFKHSELYINNQEAIKHKQGLRNWGCRGCTGGAHVCNRYEFSSAFQRNKNFENRTTFGWVREILGILELRWNNKNSQKGDFWKIFGPICTFYYIKWPPSSRFPSSRSFSRSQKPRGRRD